MKKFRNKSLPAFGAGLVVLAGVLTLLDLLSSKFPQSDSIPKLALYLAMAVFGVRASRVCVIADPESLTVRNLVKTHEFTWMDVRGFTVEASLTVELTNGGKVACTAVQPGNLTRTLGRESSADRVAAELEKLRLAYSPDR